MRPQRHLASLRRTIGMEGRLNRVVSIYLTQTERREIRTSPYVRVNYPIDGDMPNTVREPVR